MRPPFFLIVRALGVALVASATLFGSWSEAANPGAGEERELLVFAASSLTDGFSELAARFEEANPGVEVTLSTAGSQALRLQIEYGARADIFASANAQHMDALRASGLISRSATFAGNELVVVVPEQNPAQIRIFADLPRAKRMVVGTPEAPIGAYTRALFDRAALRYGPAFGAGLEKKLASQEPSARMVLAKVALGEADAAVVYRSDALTSRRVKTIEIPPEINPAVVYSMGQIASTRVADLGARWVAYARSPSGRAVLSRHGFVGSGE